MLLHSPNKTEEGYDGRDIVSEGARVDIYQRVVQMVRFAQVNGLVDVQTRRVNVPDNPLDQIRPPIVVMQCDQPLCNAWRHMSDITR
jgi:hypothetical protein